MDTLKLDRASGNTRAAYLVGTGVWNFFTTSHTQRYIKIIEEVFADPSNYPSLDPNKDEIQKMPGALLNGHYPRLYISPVAQGLNKEAFKNQNNIKLMNFERKMKPWLESRGWHNLGIYNMTAQSVSHDGAHASMESNLIKAMMLFNWLDHVQP